MLLFTPMKSYALGLGLLALMACTFPSHTVQAQGKGVLEIRSEVTTDSLKNGHIFSSNPFSHIFVTARNKDIYLYGITLRRSGRSAYTDFNRVWVSFDGRRSYPSAIMHDDMVRLQFKKPRRLGAGETKVISVYANVNAGVNAGKNVVFTPVALRSTAREQIFKSASTSNPEKVVPQKYEIQPHRYRINCARGRCFRAPIK